MTIFVVFDLYCHITFQSASLDNELSRLGCLLIGVLGQSLYIPSLCGLSAYISTKQDRALPPATSEWVWLQNLGPGSRHHLVPATSCHCPLLGARCHIPATSPSLQSPGHSTALLCPRHSGKLFLTGQVLTLAWSPSHLRACSVPTPALGMTGRGSCPPVALVVLGLLCLWPLLSPVGVHACTPSLLVCPTLCDPMDCSTPGSSVPGLLQVRIPEWVGMPSSRGSS